MPILIHPAPTDRLSADDIERWRAIPVAVAVDLGRHAGQIDPAIRPIRPPGRQPRLFGLAVTALCEPPDFGAVPLAIDRMAAGAVLVIGAGGHAETAMIGEILGGQLRRRGGAGLVCDGAVRDVGTLARWDDLPVFTRHVTPRGPASAERGAVNGPVVVGGVLVRPGDLVIGDAEAKLGREADWQRSLAEGRSLQDTFGLAVVGEEPATTPSGRKGLSRRRHPRGDMP